MTKNDLLEDLGKIDDLLSRIKSPALNRSEHESIKETMKVVAARVALSFELESKPKKENPSGGKNDA